MVENISFRNRKGHRLAGIIERPEQSGNGQFIIFVHGFTGDKHEHGLFSRASEYFCRQNFIVFRFDMTGCGESEGDFEHAGIADQRDDLLSAMDFLKAHETIQNEDIYILGFSLGAAVVLLAYEFILDVKGFSFWSPVLFPDRDVYPNYQTAEMVKAFKSKGYFSKTGLRIGRKIIRDLSRCNMAPLFNHVKRPILLIHGEEDKNIPHKSTEIGSGMFNGFAKFVSIPGADHFFHFPGDALNTVLGRTCRFFESIPSAPI